MSFEIAIMIVKPSETYFDELTDELREMILEARRFPGCMDAQLAISAKHSEILVQHKWESRQAQDEYLEWRGERGDLARLSNRLEEEPYFRSFALQE